MVPVVWAQQRRRTRACWPAAPPTPCWPAASCPRPRAPPAVFLVGLLGARLSRGIGLLGAALLALAPGVVNLCHFATPEAWLILGAAATLLLARTARRRTQRRVGARARSRPGRVHEVHRRRPRRALRDRRLPAPAGARARHDVPAMARGGRARAGRRVRAAGRARRRAGREPASRRRAAAPARARGGVRGAAGACLVHPRRRRDPRGRAGRGPCASGAASRAGRDPHRGRGRDGRLPARHALRRAGAARRSCPTWRSTTRRASSTRG